MSYGQCSTCGSREDIPWDVIRDKPKRLCRPCANRVQQISYANHRQRLIRKQTARTAKITLEELDALQAKAAGLCMLCNDPPGAKPLNVDHDHATGRVRGLLCQRCNTGLGYFRDDPVLLRKAARYVTRK